MIRPHAAPGRRSAAAAALLTGLLAGSSQGQGTPVQLFQTTGGANSQYGWDVDGLGGDVDSDGVRDFIVGAPASQVGAIVPGSAFVVSGANGATIRRHDGVAHGDRYGSAVDGIGDQNFDGVPEYIVGAPFAASFAGRIEVRDGATGAIIKQFFGLAPNTFWGSTVAGLGDLNGDGRGDYAFNGSLPGPVPALYVMSGATNQILFAQIQAPPGTTGFPVGVAPAGDVNGDGTGDISVGAVPNALVFSGVNGVLIRTLGGRGNATDGVGDVDGDGRSDVAVGDSTFSLPAGTSFGRVTVYSGATGAAIWSANGDGIADRFGFSVRAIADVDRDGVADVVGGATEDISGPFLGSGYVRLLSGTDGCPLGDFAGTQLNEAFGWAIGNLLDVDGDGGDDFAVGAYQFNLSGRVVAYKGQMSGAPVGTKFCFCASPGLGPCSNDATTPGGCKNSFGLDGKLDGYGSTSATKNDLFLVASDLPPSAPTLFVYGTTKAAGGFGVPFGNGRLCIGNPMTLLPALFADANGTAVVGPCLTNGSPSLSGVQILLQAWYADTPVSPCVATFNTTQGLDVTFTP